MTQEEKKNVENTQKTESKNWLDAFLAAVTAGVTVRVHQKIKEKGAKGEDKERVQVFEGVVLAHKGGKQKSATITVRKISDGIGVERIFPIYSTAISKIEITKKIKARRAKLTYLRTYKKRVKEIKG